MANELTYDDILTFWFEELSSKQHFVKDTSLDEMITERFHDLHGAAARGELSHWRKTPQGALAEIIVLDQFSRNMFRGTGESFAYDAQALALAAAAIERGDDQKIEVSRRSFLYMPYMHAESAAAHEKAVALFTDLGNERTLGFEMGHKEIIDQFGRFPHRNEIMGRTSSPEEVEYLKAHKGY